MSFWMSDANRLQNANRPWGQKTFYYDGVGNRTQESTTVGTTTTTDVLGYPATSNRVVQITRGASTIRQMTYDNGGNLLTDTAGVNYTYNKRNRMSVATIGAIVWNYTYNGVGQLSIRSKVSPAAPRTSSTTSSST